MLVTSGRDTDSSKYPLCWAGGDLPLEVELCKLAITLLSRGLKAV